MYAIIFFERKLKMKLRKGLKAVLTFDDEPQVQVKDDHYDYRIYVLEQGQRIEWGPDNKYYSMGPGLLEVEFSTAGMKTLEGYLDDTNIWEHVSRLMTAGRNGFIEKMKKGS